MSHTLAHADTVAGTIEAAMEWLYTVEQPAGSIPSRAGYDHRVGERTFIVHPQGRHRLPVLVMRAAGDGVIRREELDEVTRLVETCGGAVVEVMAEPASRSFVLRDSAHPSLLMGVMTYLAGCANHLGPTDCRWNGCTWLNDGHALIRLPDWPGSPQ